MLSAIRKTLQEYNEAFVGKELKKERLERASIQAKLGPVFHYLGWLELQTFLGRDVSKLPNVPPEFKLLSRAERKAKRRKAKREMGNKD